jgi:hypothetical protein
MKVEIGDEDGVWGTAEDTPQGLVYQGTRAGNVRRMIAGVAGGLDPGKDYPGGWSAFVQNELLRSCNNGYVYCQVVDGVSGAEAKMR